MQYSGLISYTSKVEGPVSCSTPFLPQGQIAAFLLPLVHVESDFPSLPLPPSLSLCSKGCAAVVAARQKNPLEAVSAKSYTLQLANKRNVTLTQLIKGASLQEQAGMNEGVPALCGVDTHGQDGASCQRPGGVPACRSSSRTPASNSVEEHHPNIYVPQKSGLGREGMRAQLAS